MIALLFKNFIFQFFSAFRLLARQNLVFKRFFFIAVVATLLFSKKNVIAQVDTTAIRFGLGGAYLFNQHRANFDTIPGIASCCRQAYGGSSSQGWGVSAFAEYPVAKLSDAATLSVTGKVSYFSGLGASLTAVERKQISGGSAFIRHELETALSALAFEPMLTLRYFKRLTASLGVQAGTFLQSSYQYREQILEPTDIVYSNGQRVFNGSNGAIPGMSALQMALVGGVGFELQVNKPGTILPTIEASYVYPLNNLVSGVDWRFASLRLGISLKFSPFRTTDLSAEEIEERIQDSLKQTKEIAQKALAEAKEARRKELTAKIGEIRPVFFDDEDTPASDTTAQNKGALLDLKLSADNFLVKILKIPQKQRIPLISSIFFGENSAVVPARYRHFSNPSDAAKFTIEGLFAGKNNALTQNVLLAHYNLANIFAKRISAGSQGNIILTGYALDNEQSPKKLAETRLNAVSSYFQDVWRIPGSRIKTEIKTVPATNTNAELLRKVEISSNDASLLASVDFDNVRRTISPPGLQLGMQISAGQGLKQWDLEASQLNASESVTLHSAQGGAVYPEKYIWDIRSKPPQSGEDIAIRLTIDDVNNNKFEAPIISVKVQETGFAPAQDLYFFLDADSPEAVEVIKMAAASQKGFTVRVFDESLLRKDVIQKGTVKKLLRQFSDKPPAEWQLIERGVQVEVNK